MAMAAVTAMPTAAAGITRAVAMAMATARRSGKKDQYYYHPDHLGSTSYVTDVDGEIFQQLEYFPFGETFVEEASNTQRTPYLFTAKELDEETGLYYFGARYYDPRTSVWQSTDPVIKDYMLGEPNDGVYEQLNLALYAYSRQNPVIYLDPNGEVWGAVGKVWKLVKNGGDVAATVAGAVADVKTITARGSTMGQRAGAAVSLASEIFSPVSVRDAKAGANAARRAIGGADDAADVAQQGVRRTDSAVDAGNASRAGAGQFRDGNNRLRNADGTFAPDGGRARGSSTDGTHGNTAGEQPATLYGKYDKDDNFLKWSITRDLNSRYTRREIDGGRLDPVDVGPRREMLRRERDLVETRPGPDNREPWAGCRQGQCLDQ